MYVFSLTGSPAQDVMGCGGVSIVSTPRAVRS